MRQNRAANERRKRELETQVRQKMLDVLALGNEITEKQLAIDSIQQQIDMTDSCIAVLTEELNVLQAELEERQHRYIQSMRYMYRNRKTQNQLVFILSAENFNQMYRRSRFVNEYATYQRAQGEAVKQKREQTEQKQQELTLARAQLDTLLARGEREKQLLTNKKTEQQQMVASLQNEQKTVQALIARQQQQEAELNARIDQMIQEELAAAQRRAEEERRRKAEQAEAQRRQQQQQQQAQQPRNRRKQRQSNNQRQNNNNQRQNNNNQRQNRRSQQQQNRQLAFNETDADRLVSTSFARCKGRLPAPITGSYRVVRGFGPYSVEGMPGVSLESKGIHMQGQAGAQARCVHDGEVSGIYNRDGVYVVMVRHGRYISAYFNLASVSVSSGQHVKANQILGNVAADHILQFRLQNGFDLLNPRPWIGR